MKVQSIDIRYSLQFLSPFHCGVGEGRGLHDRSVYRDSEGFLAIPGSTIKGLVRNNCESLARLYGVSVIGPHLPQGKDERKRYVKSILSKYDIIYALFGSPWHPGTVFFDDASLDEEWRMYFTDSKSGEHNLRTQRWQVEERSRVSINRHTKTADEGGLFTSEYGKRGLGFRGNIYGSYSYLSDTYNPPLPLLVLTAGLEMIDSIGAETSVGCGRCQVKIESLQIDGKSKDVTEVLSQLNELEYLHLAVEGWGT
ncbi:MAG TPA: RAMP superfamily CRISPR-associated protein [Bacillota bacterium]|nr:RAMP superfamily CRISPR-associated protein [Bacillota bacterium]